MSTSDRPPPYTAIARELIEGKVVPFIGSAASFAGLPDTPGRLPDGQKLAQELIDEFADYPGNDGDPLTKVAQYYEECILGRSPLYDHLRKRFYLAQADAPVNPTVEVLADIKKPLCIVTTNYDDHIERAFELAGRPYTLLTHVTNGGHPDYGRVILRRSTSAPEMAMVDPGQLGLADFGDDTIIYKLHGTFDATLSTTEDTVIVTEDDYVRFITMTFSSKIPPPALIRLFQQRHFLFLGYSLEDWNFRVILRRIQETAAFGNNYMSWAVRLGVSAIEEKFWSKRHVEVYDEDLGIFVEKLRKTLGGLGGLSAPRVPRAK